MALIHTTVALTLLLASVGALALNVDPAHSVSQGSIKWSGSAAQPGYASLRIATVMDSTTVYAVANNNVTARSLASGTFLWTQPCPIAFATAREEYCGYQLLKTVDSDGNTNVICLPRNGYGAASFSGATGAVNWNVTVEGKLNLSPSMHFQTQGQALLAEETSAYFYATTVNGTSSHTYNTQKLYAFNVATGKKTELLEVPLHSQLGWRWGTGAPYINKTSGVVTAFAQYGARWASVEFDGNRPPVVATLPVPTKANALYFQSFEGPMVAGDNVLLAGDVNGGTASEKIVAYQLTSSGASVASQANATSSPAEVQFSMPSADGSGILVGYQRRNPSSTDALHVVDVRLSGNTSVTPVQSIGTWSAEAGRDFTTGRFVVVSYNDYLFRNTTSVRLLQAGSATSPISWTADVPSDLVDPFFSRAAFTKNLVWIIGVHAATQPAPGHFNGYHNTPILWAVNATTGATVAVVKPGDVCSHKYSDSETSTTLLPTGNGDDIYFQSYSAYSEGDTRPICFGVASPNDKKQ